MMFRSQQYCEVVPQKSVAGSTAESKIGRNPNEDSLLNAFDLSRFTLWCSRPRRVMLLVAGIVVLSLADLIITIAFLRANWMMEANPVAAWLIKTTESAWSLSAFKALSVLICAALLLKVRRHLASEVAAWCALGILTVMSVMWHKYSNQFDESQIMILVQTPTLSAADDYRLGLP